MAWFVHYWDEINYRNICSSEISAREDAMRKACSLMREVVSHVAGSNGERVDIVDIRGVVPQFEILPPVLGNQSGSEPLFSLVFDIFKCVLIFIRVDPWIVW